MKDWLGKGEFQEMGMSLKAVCNDKFNTDVNNKCKQIKCYDDANSSAEIKSKFVRGS